MIQLDFQYVSVVAKKEQNMVCREAYINNTQSRHSQQFFQAEFGNLPSDAS